MLHYLRIWFTSARYSIVRMMIDKRGPLHNFADRDHCLQYMAAVGLIHGTLAAHVLPDAPVAVLSVQVCDSVATEPDALAVGFRLLHSCTRAVWMLAGSAPVTSTTSWSSRACP